MSILHASGVKGLLLAALAIILANPVSSEGKPQGPEFLPDGSVKVPSFVLPPSEYLSEEAVAFMKARSRMPAGETGAMAGRTIEDIRASTERALGSRVDAMKKRYPVDIQDTSINGVSAKIITPKSANVVKDQVLINLHGGAFQTCWPACALLESIPIAHEGNWKVITLDYRQGPEHLFPAASEDVEKVYSTLLKDYKAENVGIYGCSAGGALSAQSVAWLQKENLLRPGAIGIFGASAGRFGRGDSAYTGYYIGGEFAPPAKEGEDERGGNIRSYFEGADLNDPLVSPLVSPEVLSRFPPTLVITGTRARDLSGAVYSHYQLKKAGADAELLVGEGMSHCYIYDAGLPEARDAFGIIVDFFGRQLGE